VPALRKQVRTLEALVDDLFEVTCIDAGALTLELRPTDLSRLVQVCPALCAADKIEHILDNLVTNALRHTPPDGSVVVSVERWDDAGQVTVDDTGVAFAPDVQRRMFDRFWRGDPAPTPGNGGAGLGRTIAQGLVQGHGSRIWAESRDGGGTRVGFSLPAARESAGDLRAGSGDPPARAAAGAPD
jgi:signal transduction histidine kinase